MGEVGSGKTVVALFAMLRAAEHGHQSALMAPTETLAEQHFATIQRLLGSESVTLALLTGSTPAARRSELLSQHRFGVRQRTALHGKAPEGRAPHVLHMTATPIPRTLALCEYGDLDQTRLHERPAGRRPASTHVVSGERERARAYERIAEELRAGRQAFVVCPLVEAGELEEGVESSAQARAA